MHGGLFYSIVGTLRDRCTLNDPHLNVRSPFITMLVSLASFKRFLPFIAVNCAEIMENAARVRNNGWLVPSKEVLCVNFHLKLKRSIFVRNEDNFAKFNVLNRRRYGWIEVKTDVQDTQISDHSTAIVYSAGSTRLTEKLRKMRESRVNRWRQRKGRSLASFSFLSLALSLFL